MLVWGRVPSKIPENFDYARLRRQRLSFLEVPYTECSRLKRFPTCWQNMFADLPFHWTCQRLHHLERGVWSVAPRGLRCFYWPLIAIVWLLRRGL